MSSIVESGTRIRFTVVLGFDAGVDGRPGGAEPILNRLRRGLAEYAGGFTETGGVGGWIEGAETGGTRGRLMSEAARVFIVSMPLVAGSDETASRDLIADALRRIFAPHAVDLGARWVHLEAEIVEAMHFDAHAFLGEAAA